MALGNLSTAIQAGISGRDLAQNNASIIANNISNVNTPGYNRKQVVSESIVLSGVGAGVRATDVRRITDMYKVEQVRTMTSTINKMDILNTYYTNFNTQLGQPGQNNALTTSISNLKKNFELLSMRPESGGSKSSVIFAAQNLANDLSRLSDLTQAARKTADQQMYGCVEDVNTILQTIDALNREIVYIAGQGFSNVELLDKRDESLRQLAELMDFRVTYENNDSVSLFTTRGDVLIMTELHQLTFEVTAGISAGASYAGGTVNGILVDGDPTKDLTTVITGGKLGALIQARDEEFPAFQQALDELTGQMRDQINAIHNEGTSYNVPNTLMGTRIGLGPGTAVVGSGTVSVAIVDRATGNLVENTIIDLSGVTAVADVINQINATANATASLDANGALNIQANSAGYGIAIASTSDPVATITDGPNQYGFSHYFGLNDFFVTGNVASGVSPGISSMLTIHSSILNDMSQIANGVLDTAGAVGERVLTVGDNGTLINLAKSFSQAVNFAAAGKVPPMATTLEDYAAVCIYYTADSGHQAHSLFESQGDIFHQTLNILDSIRGVNLQEEMMSLMEWQRQLKVCTQVILTAEEMLDMMMSTKR